MACPWKTLKLKTAGPEPLAKVTAVSTLVPPTLTVTAPPFQPSPKVSSSAIEYVHPLDGGGVEAHVETYVMAVAPLSALQEYLVNKTE